MMNSYMRFFLYSLLASAIIIIDRFTKYMALSLLAENGYLYNRWLSYDLVINRGVSWGMFHSSHDILFYLVTIIIVCVTGMVMWHAYYMANKNKIVVGQICVIAGSLSNLFDRFVYGGVIDFIRLSYGTYAWPYFNGADIAIVVGVCLMLFSSDD